MEIEYKILQGDKVLRPHSSIVLFKHHRNRLKFNVNPAVVFAGRVIRACLPCSRNDFSNSLSVSEEIAEMRRRLFEELVLLLWVAAAFGLRCDKTPPEASKPRRTGDGDFSLEISGDPASYSPGHSYKSKCYLVLIALESDCLFWNLIEIGSRNISGASANSSKGFIVLLAQQVLTTKHRYLQNTVRYLLASLRTWWSQVVALMENTHRSWACNMHIVTNTL